jgi:hypothetical protein
MQVPDVPVVLATFLIGSDKSIKEGAASSPV